MNTNEPHDIIDSADLKKLRKELRAYYVPIPPQAAIELSEASVQERAEWLTKHLGNVKRRNRKSARKARGRG